jgi:hypothetical protein
MKKLTLLTISAAFIFSINSAHAGSLHSPSAVNSSKVFYLKGDAPVGSRIPSIDATSSVPFNKGFQSLTSEQQNLVKATFDNLGNNDTPPFPTSGLGAVYKPLINANQAFGNDKGLSVTAKVNSAGYVNGVTVHNNSNVQLVNYIQRRLQNTKFEPAKCNGIACDMDFPIEISFN